MREKWHCITFLNKPSLFRPFYYNRKLHAFFITESDADWKDLLLLVYNIEEKDKKGGVSHKANKETGLHLLKELVDVTISSNLTMCSDGTREVDEYWEYKEIFRKIEEYSDWMLNKKSCYGY